MQNSARGLRGEVLIPTPVSTGVLTGAIVLVVLVGLVGAGFAQFSRTESVTGRLVPGGGLIRVTAQTSGIISDLPAREGAVIAAGAPMASLRLGSTDAGGGDIGGAVRTAIAEEGEAQALEDAATVGTLEARLGSLRLQRATLMAEIDQLTNAVEISERRERLSNARVERLQTVEDNGFISAQAMDDRRLAALNAAQQTASAKVALATARREWASADAALRDLPRELAAARARRDGRQAVLSQRAALASQSNEISAVAPVAARILAVPVTRGQSVEAGTTIAILSPSDSELTAELFVPARSAGFVAAGQEVRLMYSAFPYQKFGTARGRVTQVGATVLSPAEIAASGFRIDEPAIRVQVALERRTIDAYGRTIELAPGASLDAQIIVDRRNLLEWLLDPLFAAGRRL